jgi:ABC-2 type transport system ATP-binding protein
LAAAIEVDGVTKTFRLYKEKPTSLKERVLRFRRVRYEHFTALKDIRLDIEAGTTVGLLGHNGSGKSTLLKCIAGILQPTSGVVRTTGRMAALLELGAGFHPELSGRENVYLNGSILGLKRAEVDRVFDDIVGFAELEQFIDTPVKHYSSGMYVRLGFAVAINVDPEILLVDEVLSVGDESFQRKCIDKVKTFQAEGRTIVVVTHAADLVRQMCDKAAALEHGQLVAHGEPNDVIREFRERLLKGATPAEDIDPEAARSEMSPMWGRVKIAEAQVTYASADHHAAAPNEPMRLDVTLEAPEPVNDVVVGIAIYNSMGWLVFGTNTDLYGVDLGTFSGRRMVTLVFSDVPLLDGTYAVTIGLHTKGGLVYDSWEQLRRFEVAAPGRDIGLVRLPVAIEVDGQIVGSGSTPVSTQSGERSL